MSESVGYESLLTKTVTRLFLPDLKRVFTELFIVKMGSLQYYTSAHIVNPSRFGQNIKNKRCFIDSQLSIEGSKGKLFEVKREKPMVRSFQVKNNEEVSLILKRKGSELGSPPLWLRMFLFMKELDSYRWVEGRYAC